MISNTSENFGNLGNVGFIKKMIGKTKFSIVARCAILGSEPKYEVYKKKQDDAIQKIETT